MDITCFVPMNKVACIRKNVKCTLLSEEEFPYMKEAEAACRNQQDVEETRS